MTVSTDLGQFRTLEMTVLMTPDTANFSGAVHGGHILKLLDQVAFACASRYSGSYVVTVSVDQVVFHQRIQVGELVTFIASVNYTGKSSMEIGIRVVAEQITEQVEDELYNEERIRAQLIELELRFDLGEISETTYLEAEAALLERLRVARARRAAE